MDIPTRDLGGSGMSIARVGIGAWAMGGSNWAASWGEQDDDDSIAAIHYAVQCGLNWIDTAAAYGLGHSEEVVGRAVRGLAAAERPYVFTKCGLVFDPKNRNQISKRVGAAASIRYEVEQSLRRLGLDRIDLYQMHWPAEDGAEVEEYWQCMNDLIAEGKIAAAGLSNHDVASLTRAEAIRHVTAVQPGFSLINRNPAGGLLDWCKENGTGAIVYSPMASGLLSGTWTKDRIDELSSDDWRRRNPRFQGDALVANLELVDALRPIAERHNTTVASVAIAWTLHFDAVTGAIVGARSPSQVDGWLDAATLELDDSDLELIELALAQTGAGEGPVRSERSKA